MPQILKLNSLGGISLYIVLLFVGHGLIHAAELFENSSYSNVFFYNHPYRNCVIRKMMIKSGINGDRRREIRPINGNIG